MKKYICLLLVIIITGVSQTGQAQEEMEFSIRYWMSHGQTKWRHDASTLNSLYGKPTSELDYQRVNSNIQEVGIIKALSQGHDLKLTLGMGGINEGRLVDDDYLSASGAEYYGATQSGAHRFSRTHSDINGGGVFYFRGEFFPKDFQYNAAQVNIHFGLGMHYLREEYRASGVTSVECTVLTHPDLNCLPAGSSAYQGVTVITNIVEWTGLGIAMDNNIMLSQDIQLQVDLTYYPIMSLNNEDTHHLRSDLAQNPSVRMSGNGTGYDFSAVLKYQFSREVSAQFGYQIWDRSLKNQSITFYGSQGGSSTAKLMNFRTHRDGYIAGLKFIF